MKLNYALKFAGRSTHKIKRFLKSKQSNNKAKQSGQTYTDLQTKNISKEKSPRKFPTDIHKFFNKFILPSQTFNMSSFRKSKKRTLNEEQSEKISSKKEKIQSINNMNGLMENLGFSNITKKILLHLDQKDLQACRLVCHSWKMQVDKPHLWIKKCDYKGQSEDLHNAWFDLVRRIEKGSFLEKQLANCLMNWNGLIHTYSEEELEGITPIHIATRFGFTDIVKLVASCVDDSNAPKSNGITPMYVAARFGHLDIVKFLGEKIENSYATEVEGSTPIMLAASNGHNELVQYLAKKVENPNEFASDGLWSAIFAAVQEGHIDIVKFLTTFKDFNAPNSIGCTAIHLAAEKGHTEIVNYLGSMVDNPNAPDQDGFTPIHLAAQYGQTEVIQSPIFKSNPSNYTQPLPSGRTPINLAARYNHPETVRMILKIMSDMCQTFPDEMMNALM